MKLFSLLIIVLLLITATTTSTTKVESKKLGKTSPVYVNFIPFKTGFNCQGKVDGLGYSLAIDTCISFDGYTTSWEFSWNQNTGSIIGVGYKGVCKPENRNGTTPIRFLNMGCDKGGDILLNPTRLPTQTYDYKVQISTSPLYPAQSLYLVTQRLDSCTGTIIAFEFLTNETVAMSPPKIAYGYYCFANGIPEMVDDSTGASFKGDSCDMFRPFINGSSESSYSGTSGYGGNGNTPSFINLNQILYSFGLSGSGGDTGGSGVSTAQPTTATPTTGGDDQSTGYSTGGGYSTGSGSNNDVTTGGTSDGALTGEPSTNPSGGPSAGSLTGAGDTGSNNPQTSGSSTNSQTSGSSEMQQIFLTNTCSSAS
ncbi:hypothetical protein RB653_006904 [Dictyostelium firmibasis]|uniref:Uncharacterized protein n=1 Tax=Dictyostelium firmibasis TaxID=79012 RepID=A0AAN7TVJ2_9MYCE